MPSPLNGFTVPAASPTTSQVGPALGPTEPPIGSRPLVGLPHTSAGDSSQYAGAVATYSSSRCVVFTLLKSRNVDRRPTPMFTVPSPTGKIQPYPGSGLPLRSFTSSADSIHGSSWSGLSQ